MATSWRNSKILKASLIVLTMVLVWQIMSQGLVLLRIADSDDYAGFSITGRNYEEYYHYLDSINAQMNDIANREINLEEYARQDYYNSGRGEETITSEQRLEGLKKRLDSNANRFGIYYYFENKATGEVLKNSELDYNGVLALDMSKTYNYNSHFIEKDIVFASGYDNQVWAEKNDEWQGKFDIFSQRINTIAWYTIAWLILIIFLSYLASGNPKFDKLWTEFNLLLWLACAALAGAAFVAPYYAAQTQLSMFACIELIYLLWLGLYLSIVRKIKNHQFLKASFCYAIYRWCYKTVRKVFNLDRLDVATADKVKAERMKSELVTNVSHDLKTPLTAIINYSSLLLQELPDNEKVQIINSKSLKLKELTEGLFEISKATSGNVDLHMEELSLAELINQTLAEVDTDMVFRVKVADETIRADGKLMARVFENLITNMAKYSLKGTNCYIVVNGKTIEFKNIAGYDMDFDEKEITERFVRGDSSRTDGGNGLGLAIAQSYTEACGGEMQIKVDADLFKVVIKF